MCLLWACHGLALTKRKALAIVQILQDDLSIRESVHSSSRWVKSLRQEKATLLMHSMHFLLEEHKSVVKHDEVNERFYLCIRVWKWMSSMHWHEVGDIWFPDHKANSAFFFPNSWRISDQLSTCLRSTSRTSRLQIMTLTFMLLFILNLNWNLLRYQNQVESYSIFLFFSTQMHSYVRFLRVLKFLLHFPDFTLWEHSACNNVLYPCCA